MASCHPTPHSCAHAAHITPLSHLDLAETCACNCSVWHCQPHDDLGHFIQGQLPQGLDDPARFSSLRRCCMRVSSSSIAQYLLSSAQHGAEAGNELAAALGYVGGEMPLVACACQCHMQPPSSPLSPSLFAVAPGSFVLMELPPFLPADACSQARRADRCVQKAALIRGIDGACAGPSSLVLIKTHQWCKQFPVCVLIVCEYTLRVCASFLRNKATWNFQTVLPHFQTVLPFSVHMSRVLYVYTFTVFLHMWPFIFYKMLFLQFQAD